MGGLPTALIPMIQFSPAALSEIDRLRHRQASPEAYLCITLQEKGCLGTSYRLTFMNEPIPQNFGVMNLGVGNIAIETTSLECLQDLCVDYADDLMGGNFRFDNPQAVETCGCGISFRY